MNMTVAAYLLYNLVLVISVERMMGVFFEKRKTPVYVLALSLALCYVASGFVFLMWNIPGMQASVFFVTLFVIILNYESSVLKKIIAAGGIFVCFVIVDFLAYVIVIGGRFLPFQYAGGADIRAFIFAGAIILPFSMLTRHFKNVRKSTVVIPKIWGLYLIFALASLAFTFFIASRHDVSDIALITSMAALFLINILMVYVLDALSAAFDDKLKSALHAQEKEYYFAQSQLMQESVESIKSIRHDMNSHLVALLDYAKKNNTEDAVGYLERLITDVRKSQAYSDTGNIAVDSIVNFKLKNAKEDGIALDLHLFIPPMLDMEDADIITILGNLLDNALEATAKVEEKSIRLDIRFDIGGLRIVVENTYNGEIKHSKKGGKKRIQSLKGGKDHGYGLKNILSAAEKYDSIVEIDYDEKIFSVEVLLYVSMIEKARVAIWSRESG